MNIDDVIARLKDHLAALGDGRDCRSDNEKADYRAAHLTISRTISGLMNPDLEKPTALLADLEAQRAAVIEKQRELEQQITDAPDLASFDDARERDKEATRQWSLQRQLQHLHDGSLWMAPATT